MSLRMGNRHAPDRKLAILAFHKIGEPPPNGWESWNYIPEARFAMYLDHLRDDGWQVIDLDRFLRGLVDPESLPTRAALLTFDDGYLTMLTVTLPWLERYACPAVLFVPTQYIGGTNAFDKDIEPEEPICDWDALRILESGGVAIQPHGVSHRTFSELAGEEIETELRESKAVLEAGLERPSLVFSFPYGDSGADVKFTRETLNRLGYRAACLYGGGPITLPIMDRYQLTRLAMGPDTDLGKELG
jgi:peptidoglycan/xylan/chitin deacetylase (PgdA/CDA1 family)